MIFRVLIPACLLTAHAALAADLENVAAGAAADLQKALSELSGVRHQIETERVGLARQVRELEEAVTTRRTELAKAQRFQENQLVELNALRAEAKRHADEVKFIESLLADYTRSFRSRLNFIEEPRYQEAFAAVEKATADADLASAERLAARFSLLATSLKRTEGALGGDSFDGQALDKHGLVQRGKVAVVGPVAMFASDSGDLAGLLQQELNKADPTVVVLDKKIQEGTRALVTTGKGQLALDPTLGNAFKLSALEETLFEKIAKGGWAMIPLLALGAAALIVAVVKWMQLARVPVAADADLQKVLRMLENGEQSQALVYARGISGRVGDLLATAVENVDAQKEYLEELLYEKMLGARAELERGIAFLALTATTGPLLGLLGTVMGMIATFQAISSFGSGDPKLLAAGISEALICTATGMAVAIPALLSHAFLNRKAKGIIGNMEKTAVGFINGMPTERDLSSAA